MKTRHYKIMECGQLIPVICRYMNVPIACQNCGSCSYFKGINHKEHYILCSILESRLMAKIVLKNRKSILNEYKKG